MGRGGNGKTDRFRTVFEPEDIFDRFVKNANASTETPLPDEDEVTGCTPREDIRAEPRRGGPPSWDHRITLVAPEPVEERAAGSSRQPDSKEVTAVGVPPERQTRQLSGAFDPGGDDAPVADDGTAPGAGSLTTDSGQQVLLLTQVKSSSRLEPLTPDTPQPVPHEMVFPAIEERDDTDLSSSNWESVVAPRGQHTQQVEAAKLVPDVAASRRRDTPLPSESAEDGQMPTRELDQILTDMAVLLRYGHTAQVRDRLEQLRRAFPEDLLLLRRIAEFHVETEQIEAALDALFALARGLFERRNVEGMRQALEQVRVLDVGNTRAARLLGLLEARADGTDA